MPKLDPCKADNQLSCDFLRFLGQREGWSEQTALERLGNFLVHYEPQKKRHQVAAAA